MRRGTATITANATNPKGDRCVCLGPGIAGDGARLVAAVIVSLVLVSSFVLHRSPASVIRSVAVSRTEARSVEEISGLTSESTDGAPSGPGTPSTTGYSNTLSAKYACESDERRKAINASAAARLEEVERIEAPEGMTSDPASGVSKKWLRAVVAPSSAPSYRR
jgi:hypothetical protein